MKQLILFCIIALVGLTGCGGSMSADSAANTTAGSAPGGGGGGAATADSLSKPPMPMDMSVAADQIPEPEKAPTERMIVRNADMRLESGSPEEIQTKISDAVKAAGGFVIESSQSSTDGSTGRDTVTKIRVPAEKFDATLAEIRKSADRVVIETIKGDDVTEEFVDVEARLNAKRAVEQQFIEIMKRANTVEDALKVQTQLGDVRSEIERIEGRKRFLQDQAALSTITVEIRTPAAFAANSKGFSYRFVESVSNGFDVALDFILGLVSFAIAILPFVLFIVLPIYLIVRYLWRKRRQRRTAAEIIEQELSSET